MDSPDLPEHWSGSDGDEHRLQVGTAHHLNLPLLDDVHLPADLALKHAAGQAAAQERLLQPGRWVLTFLQTKSPGR